VVGLLVCVLLTVLVMLTGVLPAGSDPGEPGRRAVPPPLAAGERPIVVVVVMDDVSLDLLPAMGELGALAQQGATYENAQVVNTLCCPSRAATFTGQPPHLNGVLTNTSGGPLRAKGG